MTPQQKLKEIEEDFLEYGGTDAITTPNMEWLIFRIKVLEESLEFCSVINMPMKAVKGEDFAQYALEEHCRVSRKGFAGEEK